MKTQYLFTLMVLVLETLTYAGVMSGWAALYPVLVAEGYFASKCNNTTQLICESQTEQLNLVYTISTALAPVVGLYVGRLFDIKGGWITRTILLFIIALGNLLNVVSNIINTSWLLYISFPLISIGGYGLAITTLSLSNLYPAMRGLVISLLTGAFDSAAVVYLLFSKFYALGVSFNAFFLFYAFVFLLYNLHTFLLTPRYPPPNVLPENYTFGYRELPYFRDKNISVENSVDDVGIDDDDSDDSLRTNLTKFVTWTNIVHFCVFNFSLTFFIGSFNNWIRLKIANSSSSSADMVAVFTKVFVTTQCLALFISPISGLVNDYFRHKFLCSGDPRTASMRGVSVSLLIGDTVIIMMLIFALLPNVHVQYTTMMLQVIGRSFLYSTSATFITVGYPSKYLGVMYSMMECVGGLVLLLQFPITLLVTRVFNNNFDYAYVLLLCLCIMSLLHPIYLLYFSSGSSKRRSEVTSFASSNSTYTDEK